MAAALAAAPNGAEVTQNVQAQLTKSFAGATSIAEHYPQYSTQIVAGAKDSFLSDADWAYLAGVVAVVVGGLIVYFLFPRRERERELLASYHAEATHAEVAPGATGF